MSIVRRNGSKLVSTPKQVKTFGDSILEPHANRAREITALNPFRYAQSERIDASLESTFGHPGFIPSNARRPIGESRLKPFVCELEPSSVPILESIPGRSLYRVCQWGSENVADALVEPPPPRRAVYPIGPCQVRSDARRPGGNA